MLQRVIIFPNQQFALSVLPSEVLIFDFFHLKVSSQKCKKQTLSDDTNTAPAANSHFT